MGRPITSSNPKTVRKRERYHERRLEGWKRPKQTPHPFLKWQKTNREKHNAYQREYQGKKRLERGAKKREKRGPSIRKTEAGWELRDLSSGEVIEVFTTRDQARQARKTRRNIMFQKGE